MLIIEGHLSLNPKDAYGAAEYAWNVNRWLGEVDFRGATPQRSNARFSPRGERLPGSRSAEALQSRSRAERGQLFGADFDCDHRSLLILYGEALQAACMSERLETRVCGFPERWWDAEDFLAPSSNRELLVRWRARS